MFGVFSSCGVVAVRSIASGRQCSRSLRGNSFYSILISNTSKCRASVIQVLVIKRLIFTRTDEATENHFAWTHHPCSGKAVALADHRSKEKNLCVVSYWLRCIRANGSSVVDALHRLCCFDEIHFRHCANLRFTVLTDTKIQACHTKKKGRFLVRTRCNSLVIPQHSISWKSDSQMHYTRW